MSRKLKQREKLFQNLTNGYAVLDSSHVELYNEAFKKQFGFRSVESVFNILKKLKRKHINKG